MGYGVWKNLVFHSNFHGAEGMARASEKGRGEGKSLQEIYFWIINFLVLGVWLGALGQGPQGEEEAGLENFEISTVRLGKDSVRWKTRCGVASRSSMTPVGIETKTTAHEGMRGTTVLWSAPLGWYDTRRARNSSLMPPECMHIRCTAA